MRTKAKSTSLLALALVLLISAAAAAESKAQPPETEAVKSQVMALAQAKKAVSNLRSTLMGQVKKAMKSGGASAAVQVCSKQAAKLTADVAKRHGLRIGRTSNRLRNPKNRAPSWMEAILKQEAALKGHQVKDLPAAYGLAFPITTAQACTRCHGEKEKLDPKLIKRLDALYPSDQATGFKKGDRRGWFWVEVPKTD